MIRIKVSKKMTIAGAVVVILDENKKVLILKRPDFAHWAPLLWGLPGGKMEEGEAPLDTAIRETKEETNLDVEDLKVLKLDVDIPVAAYYTSTYEGEVRLDFEHDDWTWASRVEIEEHDLAPDVLKMYDWVLKNG
tara:strand:- start:2821 stop:3225 length:405 start_codon:yes stop_codon:yes gene_type:complete